MARRTRSSKLETRTARLKLEVRKKPYGAPIAPGVILQYRRNAGPGTWIVRLTAGGTDKTIRVALADDYQDGDGRGVLDFWQAQDAARERAKEYGGDAAPVTLRQALDDYGADLKTRGADPGNAQRARAHLPPDWLDRVVASLKAGELRKWRDRLAKKMAPASVNRTATAMKAVLNRAADNDERIVRRPWETDLKGLPGAQEARNVVLSDTQVRAVIEEAYRIHVTLDATVKGDARAKLEAEAQRAADAFGLMVETLAVTGARISQAARLEGQDIQVDGSDARLMMPSSRKGRGAKKISRRPVPIPPALAMKLRAAAAGRAAAEPLLVKGSGEPWAKSDHDRPFRRVVAALQAKAKTDARKRGTDPEKAAAAWDDVTLYALRHSSITRQLIAGVPIRLVAAAHDTSVAMIEATYSDKITSHTDEMLRRVMFDTGASSATTSNVIPLAPAAAR